jgi:hypothetical protein
MLLRTHIAVYVVFDKDAGIRVNDFSDMEVGVSRQVRDLSPVWAVARANVHDFGGQLVLDLLKWLVLMSSA